MRISLYDYVTDPLLPQKDGVNLAHEDIANLLKENVSEDLAVSFHDFNRLLSDENYARDVLSNCDCVISNIGPHAHYYFYLRERLGLEFRILRDVRTAIWSSYLLQEHLCAPYLRNTDMLMAASHYARGVYEKIFPHLCSYHTFRCYPLTGSFPTLPPRRTASGNRNDPFVLGYIGRLSEDKNFPDLLELLVALNKSQPGSYKLLACGDIHSPTCHPEHVSRQLEEALGDGDYFEYLPPRPHSGVWEIYRQFDAMIFPSTSNLETFGRVLIEASYAGVPVVSGEHAAAAELMPSASLCRVAYNLDALFDTHYDHCLGSVDIDDMVKAVANPELGVSTCHREYASHPEKFLRVLAAQADGYVHAMDSLELTDSQHAFISSLDVNMPAPLSVSNANETIEIMIPWFLTLQQWGSDQHSDMLEKLTALTTHPGRTQTFIDKCAITNSDFTNVGGIDIELCHIVRFYPEFVISGIEKKERLFA